MSDTSGAKKYLAGVGRLLRVALLGYLVIGLLFASGNYLIIAFLNPHILFNATQLLGGISFFLLTVFAWPLFLV